MKVAVLLLATVTLAYGQNLLHVLKRAASDTHQGSCPASSGLAGICIFIPGVNCISDSECQQDEKCCSEGCGRVCKKVVDNGQLIKVHAGTCPAPSGLVGICVIMPNSCIDDSECLASQKCCHEGCGKICKTALH